MAKIPGRSMSTPNLGIPRGSLSSRRLKPAPPLVELPELSSLGVERTTSLRKAPLAATSSASAQERLVWLRLFIMVPIVVMTAKNIIGLSLDFSVGAVFSKSPAAPDPNQKNVDIISVGSVLKEAFQDAQQRTFGSHGVVRDFYRITEMNDTDRGCFNDLMTDQIDDIISFCGVREGQSFISKLLRDRLFKPKKHAGWVCAQKRPIFALYQVLQKYREAEGGVAASSLPDYLFIIDDDTYLNLDSVTDTLRRDFPPTVPNLLTGCNFEFLVAKSNFTFPYGGFGSFLPRAAVQRLLQPIDCGSSGSGSSSGEAEVEASGADAGGDADPFAQLACWRLERNAMGEQRFFQNGMSVADLMYQFAAQQPFADVENWKESGYCFHSDHAFAYFFNFYHIAVPDSVLREEALEPKDKYRHKFKYKAFTGEPAAGEPRKGRVGECSNERESCTSDNQVCHYVAPDQMEKLWKANLEENKRKRDTKQTAETILVVPEVREDGFRADGG